MPETEENLTFDEWADDTGKFAMQVVGESMIEEHIADGDFVIITRQNWARDGQVIAVKDDDGEPYLRRYFREKDRVRLEAGNKSLPPVYRNTIEILGVLVGVVRKY